MYVQCAECGRVYDDAQRWTICPHRGLGHAPLTVGLRDLLTAKDNFVRANVR